MYDEVALSGGRLVDGPADETQRTPCGDGNLPVSVEA